jgi:hypothetical protein
MQGHQDPLDLVGCCPIATGCKGNPELYAIFHHYYRAIKIVFCRLIVVAEKQIVYDKFPIPLINRLEKHFLSLKTLLPPAQLELADKLQKWAQNLCKDKTPALYGQK